MAAFWDLQVAPNVISRTLFFLDLYHLTSDDV